MITYSLHQTCAHQFVFVLQCILVVTCLLAGMEQSLEHCHSSSVGTVQQRRMRPSTLSAEKRPKN